MNNNLLRLFTFYMLLPLKMVSLCRIMIWTDELEGNQLQYDTTHDTNLSVEDGFLAITACKENYQTKNDTSDLATLMKPPVSLKAQTYTTRTCLNMGIPCDQ